MNRGRPKTTPEEWIEEATKVRRGKYDYSEVLETWISTQSRIKVRCLEHDEIFYTTPYAHLNMRSSCVSCRREGRAALSRQFRIRKE